MFAEFLIHVLLFPLIRGTFVYFLCTRVAPLCAFYLILLLRKKKVLCLYLSSSFLSV
jgi:hypothetical protein